MSEYRLSITLITRNRPDSLERALQSIRSQSFQPIEVLVGNDSSPEFEERVRFIVAQHGARYVPGPQRGLAANRNHLFGLAQGTHIRTMDDDHELIEDHLNQCHGAIDLDPHAVWVIGEQSTLNGSTRFSNCPGQLNSRGYMEAPFDPDDCWSLADGATIYPREIFDRGLRLPEMFRLGHAYTEMGSRLHWLGYRIRFLKSTYIIHHTEEFNRPHDSVWYGDLVQIEGSRIFAALSHSFIYKPTLTNRFTTIFECARELIKRPRGSSIRLGLAAFRRHRLDVTKARRDPAFQTSS